MLSASLFNKKKENIWTADRYPPLSAWFVSFRDGSCFDRWFIEDLGSFTGQLDDPFYLISSTTMWYVRAVRSVKSHDVNSANEKRTYAPPLRNKPISGGMSEDEVISMLKGKDLFDKNKNVHGIGFHNYFVLNICQLSYLFAYHDNNHYLNAHKLQVLISYDCVVMEKFVFSFIITPLLLNSQLPFLLQIFFY